MEAIVFDFGGDTFGNGETVWSMGVVDFENGLTTFGEELGEFVEEGIDKEITLWTAIEGDFGFEVFNRWIQCRNIFGGYIGEISENQIKFYFGKTFKEIRFLEENIFGRRK